MQDWAEVHRLYHREHLSKSAIARRLGMTRNTVMRMLARSEPPRYRRTPKGSMLDPHRQEIAAMLDQDPKVPAAHAAVFSHSKTLADVRPAFVGCFERLGGVPEAVVVDNDPSIIAQGKGRTARLHDEVAALFGHLGAKVVVLEPRRPESKGQVERTNGYLETSFLPLREFSSLQDAQDEHDDWASGVAWRRHHRRVGSKVADAWAVERGFLRALPDPLPDTDTRLEVRVSKDGFCRVGDADYSVPPGLFGRRVQVRLQPSTVVITLDGTELARHDRSFVPADVVLSPAHARALRLAREAKAGLRRRDVALPEVDLARYDAILAGSFLDPACENGSERLQAAGSGAGAAR